MAIQKRYWDANTFIGHFNKNEEPWKKERCDSVLKAAEAGRIIIVTSYITYTEVLKIKGESGFVIPKTSEQMIRDFFEQEYIVPRIVDRQISELARDLIWEYNVKPKDAIHAATAVKLKIAFLDTFDKDLLDLNGKIGNPQILIAPPPILEEQQELSLSYPDGEVPDDDEDADDLLQEGNES